MLVLMWSIRRFVNMFVDPNLSSQTMNDSPLREIYVSTDIETDGPVAGKHSMLSIGSAAYLADKELLGTFSANLETLPASARIPRPPHGGPHTRTHGQPAGKISKRLPSP